MLELHRTNWTRDQLAVGLLAAGLLGGGTGIGTACAQTSESNVQIAYYTPVACPSKGDFVASILARERRLLPVTTSSNLLLTVRVVEVRAGFAGTLQLFVDGTLAFERELADVNCAALVEAFALLAAMELHPRNEGVGAVPTLPVVSAGHQQKRAQETHASTALEGTSEAFGYQLGAVAALQTSPTPEPLFAFGAHAGVVRRVPTQHLGLSLLYGQTGLGHYAGGDVRFRWASGRFMGCPIGISYRQLSVLPCAVTEIGLLRAEPTNTIEGTSRNGWWIAPGAGGLLRLQGRWLFIDWFGGIVRPIVRDSFYFAEPASDTKAVVRIPAVLGLISEFRVGTMF
ncbi:MAG TPA: hypothetical protein VIV60_31415 [Polyangiaceae bacterium]